MPNNCVGIKYDVVYGSERLQQHATKLPKHARIKILQKYRKNLHSSTHYTKKSIDKIIHKKNGTYW